MINFLFQSGLLPEINRIMKLVQDGMHHRKKPTHHARVQHWMLLMPQ